MEDWILIFRIQEKRKIKAGFRRREEEYYYWRNLQCCNDSG